eukprot:gene32847-41855_t
MPSVDDAVQPEEQAPSTDVTPISEQDNHQTNFIKVLNKLGISCEASDDQTMIAVFKYLKLKVNKRLDKNHFSALIEIIKASDNENQVDELSPILQHMSADNSKFTLDENTKQLISRCARTTEKSLASNIRKTNKLRGAEKHLQEFQAMFEQEVKKVQYAQMQENEELLQKLHEERKLLEQSTADDDASENAADDDASENLADDNASENAADDSNLEAPDLARKEKDNSVSVMQTLRLFSTLAKRYLHEYVWSNIKGLLWNLKEIPINGLNMMTKQIYDLLKEEQRKYNQSIQDTKEKKKRMKDLEFQFGLQIRRQMNKAKENVKAKQHEKELQQARVKLHEMKIEEEKQKQVEKMNQIEQKHRDRMRAMVEIEELKKRVQENDDIAEECQKNMTEMKTVAEKVQEEVESRGNS